MTHRRPAVALVMLTVLVAGCGDGERIASDRQLPAVVFEVDPDPDPKVVAWAGCLDQVTTCIDGGGTVRGCTTAEACGQDCVSALDRALVGAEGLEAELDAFESVFINPGAVCRAAEPDRR